MKGGKKPTTSIRLTDAAKEAEAYLASLGVPWNRSYEYCRFVVVRARQAGWKPEGDNGIEKEIPGTPAAHP